MGETDLSTPPFVVTYHLALHRHLAAGIVWCLYHPNCRHLLKSLLLTDERFLRKIALHPMRIQVCRAEAAAGMWARNGNAARNMSFYYAQTNYNTAFLDCDLALLRYVATNCDSTWFLDTVGASFFLDECLKSNCFSESDFIVNRIVTRKEWCVSLIEGALRLIVELVAIRWNVGGSEVESIEKEIVAALAISDLTHSKLRASIPEQGNCSSAIDCHFDELLMKVAHYDEPDQGSHIQQGVYRLTNKSWWNRFDPIFCCCRSTVAKEYNDALLRVEEVERLTASRATLLRLSGHLWTPYRLLDFDVDPSEDQYSTISSLFVSPLCFAILRRVLTLQIVHQQLNEDILQRAVYLLTLAARFAISKQFSACYKPVQEFNTKVFNDLVYDQTRPTTFDDRSFVLSMFTYSLGEDPPILSLLLRCLSEQFVSLEPKIDSKRIIADALLEQLRKPIEQLDRISGGAVEYIGRLLNILFYHDFTCKKEIERYIGERSEVPASRSDDVIAKSKAERRLAAKRHQEAVLAAHMKKNASLMVRMMEREGLDQSQMDEMDTSSKAAVRHYECPICGDTTTSTLEHPVGLLVQPFNHYAISNSVSKEEPDFSLLEIDEVAVQNKGCLPERLMLKYWNLEHKNLLKENLYADVVHLEANTEIRSCGHFAHISCFDTYVETLADARAFRINPIDPRNDILCFICRAKVNGLLPLAPDYDCERTRLSLIDSTNDEFNKVYYQAVKESVGSCKPVFTEKLEEQFSKYLQTFHNFTSSCRKQSMTVEEVFGQSFVLGLAKTKIEKNVLIAELGIVCPSDRAVSTEHLLYGACFEATVHDINFTRLQCKQFLRERGSDAEKAESLSSTMTEDEQLPNNVEDIDDISNTGSRVAVVNLNSASNEEFSIPLPLLDLNSVLLRISAFIIARVDLYMADKLRLLSFIYKRFLLAKVVRTALFLAARMPSSQLELFERQQSDSLLSLGNPREYLVALAQNVAISFLTRPLVQAESILASNKVNIDWEEVILYSATALSRFTLQLWHECGIKKIPAGIDIGNASFVDLYDIVSSIDDAGRPLCQYLKMTTLSSWVDSAVSCIQSPRFLRVLRQEPVVWRPFVLLQLPVKYDDLFSRFFLRRCINCDTVPRTPLICLLCSKLVCLDQCCFTPTQTNPTVLDNEVEKHALECGSGAGCFLAINSSLIVIVTRHMAIIWGSVYLDIHGEEDRNLKRGKPLYLSKRRYEKLRADWLLQSFDQTVVSPFAFEHLPVFLRDAHFVSNF